MNSIRNLFVLTVVLTLMLSMAAVSAFAQSFDVEDATNVVAGSASTNVTLLRGTFESLMGPADQDTLVAIHLKSCIESAFAVKQLIVVHKRGGTSTTVATQAISGAFNEDVELQLSGLTQPVQDGDSLIFKVNVWTDSTLANAGDYDGTGMELVIFPDGLDLSNNGLYSLANTYSDGTPGTSSYGHNPGWNPLTCSGTPTAVLDLEGPVFTPNFFAHIDSTDCNANEVYNIGDKIRLYIPSFNEQVDSTDVTADLSAFGLSATHNIPYVSGFGWLDTIRVDAGALDVVPPFVVTATATDIYGNSTTNSHAFNTEFIDNIAPEIDSVKFAIYSNSVGPADEAAITDQLVLWVYTGSSGFFEVDDVVADISRFVPGATSEDLTDVTTGAGVWRLIFELTDPLPIDLGEGADTAKVAIVTVVDNGCNVAVDTVDFLPAIDLEPPFFSDDEYITLNDADETGCTNLGDEVRVEADVSGNDDIMSVWGDLFHAGLGGASNAAFTNEGSGIWAYEITIGDANDPVQDPPTLQAKDSNSDPVDADFRVWVYVADDAGNVDSVLVGPLLNTAGSAFVPLDTRRPIAIIQDSVMVEQLPGGELRLKWDKDADAGDAVNFYIYVDSTGSDINYSNVFGTTFNGEFPDPTYNYWYSGPLTHGKTYRFSIRTQDDCGNFEFNKAIFEGIPDAEAPTACVQFPTSGGQYGPNNPLSLTAVSTDSDIDAAYAIYRLIDQGDGNPGPWYNYPGLGSSMTQNGLTFTQTLNLGTSPSTAGEYELYIIGVDEVGNELALDDAMSGACGQFTFTWNPNALVCDVLTINGAFAPQTSCGFDVTRDDLNEAVVSIVDPEAGDNYDVDVWVLVDDVRTRIDYAHGTSLPYTFMFSAIDWPKTQGTSDDATMWVAITDNRSGNNCETNVDLCVPDQVAPHAMITSPVGYSCVPIMQAAGDPIEITVEVDPNFYDSEDAVRAEFYYSMTGSTEDGVQIGVEPFVDGESTVGWDNSAMEEGMVWLYAVVYDGLNNSYTTPFVKICIDGSLPVMEMFVKDAKFIEECGGEPMWRLGPEQNNGVITVQANLVNKDAIDITDPVVLFFSDVNDPDIFYYYDQNPSYTMDYVNNSSIWAYDWEFADDLACGHTYRVRLAVKDQAGNWMFDNDGDGNFDDYTFDDAMNNGSGMLVTYDCEPPHPAFSLYQTDGDETRTWLNPSTKLNGIGDVYALAGEDITVQLMTLPADDSCQVAKVDYYLCGTFIGSSTDYQGFWEVTFNPVELGLFNPEDVQDEFGDCTLEAVMYDQVGNSDTDDLDVYFLDNIPASAYIIDPDDGDCVAGDVDLRLLIFDNQPVKKVAWYYWTAGGTDTTLIAEVTPEILVKATGGGGNHFWSATWQTLNSIPDGDYVIAAAVCDYSDNYTPKDQAMVNVTVANGLPTATITSPADGGFFCAGEYFCADVDANGGCPIDNVTFQFKSSFDSDWINFGNSPDYQAPWCATLDDDEGDIDRDGWYDFRAVVTNQSGVTRYSDPIRLYYDGTDPRASMVTATDGETVWDIENNNDPSLNIPMGTQQLTFTLFAADDQSVNGTSPTFNSGISSVCINGDPATSEVCLDVTPDANGYFDVPWDISGITNPGEYELNFTVYDNACGATDVSVTLNIIDVGQPTGMIAGCWNGRIYGMTWEDQNVLFEKSSDAGANWVPVAVAHGTYCHEPLLLPNGSYSSKDFEVYWTEWKPADGNYMIRMRVEGGDASPALGVSVAGGVCTVTSNPQDFGPGTIERNKENGCDNLEGIGRFGSAYGMPYGIAVAYNVPNDSWGYDIIQFNALPQQGTTTQYAGPFNFYELNDGGFGWGHVFFFDADDAGETAYSSSADYKTFWVTRDFGTGGPVWFADNSVSVDVPAEATDNTGTDNNAVAIWKSRLARATVFDDYYWTPVGDNNGMMTYISDPSCNDWCLDDGQYAIINMQYDNNETTDPNKLSVARWDGEGYWRTQNIFFPSTVRGFYQQDGQNWVEFAVDCLGGNYYDSTDDAWYAVVKKTQYDGQPLITRYQMIPDCDNYTNGYPDFWYQLDETFAGQLDFSSLDIWLDGVPIFEGAHDGILPYESHTKKDIKNAKRPSTNLSGESDIVDVWYDDITNRVMIEFYGYWYENESGSYYQPLACGEHTLKMRISDFQSRPQFIEDVFNVDCNPPDVNFDNYYTAKNPVIQFTIDDDLSGVNWAGVYVDVFFVTKANLDGTNGTPNETVEFAQTFFPAQIQDYLQEDGRTVRIPTSYDLENRRAIIAVVYDGYYEHQLNTNLYDLLQGILNGSYNIGQNDPSFYSAFDYYYYSGAYDCVGNWTDPFVQYLPIDAAGPVVDVNDSSSPIRLHITDQGSGLDPESIKIYSNGTLVTSEPVGSADAVDAPGDWYFETTNDGGILWFYPDGDWEVRVADMSGNETDVTGNGGGTIADGSVSGWAGPNPYDPAMDGNMAIHYSVGQGKVTNVTCSIYDQAGDLVTALAPQSAASGTFTWAGTTSGGRMVAKGVYFAVIQAQGNGGSSAVVKIAVVEK